MGGGAIFGVVNYAYVFGMMCMIVVFTATFERLCEDLEQKLVESPQLLKCLKKMYKELMILGFISFSIVIVQELVTLDHDLLICFEFAHIWIFVVMAFYILNSLFTFYNASQTIHLWIMTDNMSLEDLCNEWELYRESCFHRIDVWITDLKQKLGIAPAIHIERKMQYKFHKLYFLKEYCIGQDFDFVKYSQRVTNERIENALEFRGETWLTLFVLFMLSAMLSLLNDHINGVSVTSHRRMGSSSPTWMGSWLNSSTDGHEKVLSMATAKVVYLISFLVAVLSCLTHLKLKHICRKADNELVRQAGAETLDDLADVVGTMQDELDAIDASGKSGDNRDNFLGRIRKYRETYAHAGHDAVQRVGHARSEHAREEQNKEEAAVNWKALCCGSEDTADASWFWPSAEGAEKIITLPHINLYFFIIELITLMNCFNLAFLVCHLSPVVIPVLADGSGAWKLFFYVCISGVLTVTFLMAPTTAGYFSELLAVLYLDGEEVTRVLHYMEQVKKTREQIMENLLREAKKNLMRDAKVVPEDKTELYALTVDMLFDDLDDDDSGTLSYNELRLGMFKYGCQVGKNDFNRIMRILDPDRERQITRESWEQFLGMTEDNIKHMECQLVQEEAAGRKVMSKMGGSSTANLARRLRHKKSNEDILLEAGTAKGKGKFLNPMADGRLDEDVGNSDSDSE